MKPLLLLIVSVSLCFAASPRAEAEESSPESAEALFRQGVELFEQEQFDEALDSFQRSYELNPVNIVLFNMANCQRALGQLDEALVSFAQYLVNGGDRIPDERRTSVQAAIEEMRADLDERRAQETSPPPDSTETTEGPDLHIGEEPEPDDGREGRSRWWVWALIGGVAAAGLAVGLGVGLTRNDEPPESAYPVHLP